MVPNLDIVFGTENAMAERGVHYGSLEVDGKSYLTDVEYCLNPACDCRSVRAVFSAEVSQKCVSTTAPQKA